MSTITHNLSYHPALPAFGGQRRRWLRLPSSILMVPVPPTTSRTGSSRGPVAIIARFRTRIWPGIVIAGPNRYGDDQEHQDDQY